MKINMWIGGYVNVMHITFYSLSICLSVIEQRSCVKVKYLSLCFVCASYLPHTMQNVNESLLKNLAH